MKENNIFDLLENYKQEYGKNYGVIKDLRKGYAVQPKTGKLWANYLLDKNYMMTGYFMNNSLVSIQLFNNAVPQKDYPPELESQPGASFSPKPRISYDERTFCLLLTRRDDKPLMENVNFSALDTKALSACIKKSTEAPMQAVLREFYLSSLLGDCATETRQMFLNDGSPEKGETDLARFLEGRTREIEMPSWRCKSEEWFLSSLILDSKSVPIRQDDTSLRYVTENRETGVSLETYLRKEKYKGRDVYAVCTQNADLEYAGAESDYARWHGDAEDACGDFALRCTSQANNAGLTAYSPYFVYHVANLKAEAFLLGGREGNGGETKETLTEEDKNKSPKKKPKTMER